MANGNIEPGNIGSTVIVRRTLISIKKIPIKKIARRALTLKKNVKKTQLNLASILRKLF